MTVRQKDRAAARRGVRCYRAFSRAAAAAALIFTAAAATAWAADPAGLSVTFGGSGFYPVEMDGYGRASGPHWPVEARLPAVSPDLPGYYRERGAPVAYRRGATPEARVTFPAPRGWNANAGRFRVEGTGPRGLRFAGDATPAGDGYTATVRASKPLPDAVDAFASFDVAWTAIRERPGGRPERTPLGTSRGSLYVVLGDRAPIGPLLHTPLHLSATAARGLTDPAQVLKRVWEPFARRDVRRVRDGLKLTYYGFPNDSAPAELRRMLVSGTGQCVAWSYLLYAALGAQGIPAEITLIVPPDRGRIFVGPWRFIEGRRFLDTGEDGVADTAPQGDDVALIVRGKGQPYARLWTAPALPIPPALGGDDAGRYGVGVNGIAETPFDTGAAVRLIPSGFGLENQRAFMLKPDADPSAVRLGGDDVLARQINTTYVLTGANGILETERQDAVMQTGRATGGNWDPQVGRGATGIRVESALPRAAAAPRPGGDDRAGPWWVDTGADGVSQTPGAGPEGRGAPFTVAIAPGPNGVLDTAPKGDDTVRDLGEYLDLAPAGYQYVSRFSLWPPKETPAQNNAVPPPDYPNHMIVRVGDAYYDPSYGTGPFARPLDWERASLAGVGVRIQKGGENVRFQERILTVVRRSDGNTPLTSFIKVLPPD
ncbi:MAG TPA: hypothetical protein VM490_12325 [Armatimonadaceae bacterium]|nr:hypothetical protein [Armatimonadaceae bacterium]